MSEHPTPPRPRMSRPARPVPVEPTETPVEPALGTRLLVYLGLHPNASLREMARELFEEDSELRRHTARTLLQSLIRLGRVREAKFERYEVIR